MGSRAQRTPVSEMVPAPVARAGAHTLWRDPAGAQRADLAPDALRDIVRGGRGELWVDVDARDPAQLALLADVFAFHPLAIEDTRNPATRVKLEEYDGYLFIVMRGVSLERQTADPYDLRAFTVNFFLGANYLVTVHAEPVGAIRMVADQQRRGAELLSRGAERLMHAIMDALVDAYLPVVDEVDELSSRIDERVLAQPDRAVLQDIFAIKRTILALRRYLVPHRDLFNLLTNRPSALLTPESQLYFRDIYDHVLRGIDALDAYRDLLGSTLDAYLTQVSNRLNLATKGLTIVATLSVPFVVLSGMWGMNVGGIPFGTSPAGFWILLGIQLAIALALFGMLRWLRWL